MRAHKFITGHVVYNPAYNKILDKRDPYETYTVFTRHINICIYTLVVHIISNIDY